MKTQFACSYLFKKPFQLISEIRSLSADCLPSLIKVNVSGVSSSQLFGRSVANFFNPMGITLKKHKDRSTLFAPLHCLEPLTQFIDLNHTIFGRSRKAFDRS
ncbi:hypothetical protein J7E95_02085 [Streptomyces sp. ISL-14]|nr:hypothetical protein [Streptomyces sp. ISL-14]